MPLPSFTSQLSLDEQLKALKDQIRQAPASASYQLPPSRQTMTCPCGRPQRSQRPAARPKRITAESCGQSIG